MRSRWVCCLDLDTFFVSVERLLDPSLQGRPVIVGGRRGGPGVVTACSYEVRAYGVRSGMSMREASKLAPVETVFLSGRHGVYSPYAQKVRAVLERYTPVVQAASVDEFYLDFTGTERLYHQPGDQDGAATIERTIRHMRESIHDEVGLPASAGIGGSRIVAKIASGRAKPAGVFMVRHGAEGDFLRPLPVRKFPGIGPRAEVQMQAEGLYTLHELVAEATPCARERFARTIAVVEREMCGHGSASFGRERPAFREHDPVGQRVGSISNERTFFAALDDEQRVLDQLLGLTERVCWRARKRGLRARTVSLKLRTTDFHTVQRSSTGPATAEEKEMLARVQSLYRKVRPRASGLSVRLVGIALSNLVDDGGQLALPFTQTKRVAAAVDAIRGKCGYDAVRLGAVAKADGATRAYE